MAFHLAIRNGVKRPFQEESEATKKWLRFFLQSHPVIYVKTPEGISVARVKGFTSEKVARGFFFDMYESELRKVNHPIHRIVSVDEMGIATVQHRNSKVVSMKAVASLTSAVSPPYECHWNVPHFNINRVPEKNMKEGLMDGAPAGLFAACHPSGCIQTNLRIYQMIGLFCSLH
jgi:hypothetical protein